MLKKAIKGKEQDVMNELTVLSGLQHDNIVRLALLSTTRGPSLLSIKSP